MILSQERVEYPTEVKKKFKSLGVLFMRRRERDTDRIGATAAVVQMLYWSIVVKKAECKSVSVWKSMGK